MHDDFRNLKSPTVGKFDPKIVKKSQKITKKIKKCLRKGGDEEKKKSKIVKKIS